MELLFHADKIIATASFFFPRDNWLMNNSRVETSLPKNVSNLMIISLRVKQIHVQSEQ